MEVTSSGLTHSYHKPAALYHAVGFLLKTLPGSFVVERMGRGQVSAITGLKRKLVKKHGNDDISVLVLSTRKQICILCR